MTANNNLEVEIKFHVSDLDAFREELVQAGAEQTRPRVHERNIRFDKAGEELRRKEQLLRLRQDDRNRLTLKGMPPDETESEVKVREELELEVSDFDMMAQILQKIGFEPMQVYEKYRETFTLEAVEIVLDELPFGNFIELEGPEDKIKELAGRFSMNWEGRILHNYLALMEEVQQQFNLPFDDLTFENFEGKDISIADILPLPAPK